MRNLPTPQAPATPTSSTAAISGKLLAAAKIRTEAPCRLQLFSTDEGFMWVYEQRQTVKESSHA